MKFRRLLLVLFVFGIGWMSAVVLPPNALLPDLRIYQADASAPQEPWPASQIAQQQYGSRCSTPRRICSLPRPQPLGSTCFCGSERGTTIR